MLARSASLKALELVDKLPSREVYILVNGELHKLTVTTIRKLAAGERYSGNRDKLIQILAMALKNELD